MVLMPSLTISALECYIYFTSCAFIISAAAFLLQNFVLWAFMEVFMEASSKNILDDWF